MPLRQESDVLSISKASLRRYIVPLCDVCLNRIYDARSFGPLSEPKPSTSEQSEPHAKIRSSQEPKEVSGEESDEAELLAGKSDEAEIVKKTDERTELTQETSGGRSLLIHTSIFVYESEIFSPSVIRASKRAAIASSSIYRRLSSVHLPGGTREEINSIISYNVRNNFKLQKRRAGRKLE